MFENEERVMKVFRICACFLFCPFVVVGIFMMTQKSTLCNSENIRNQVLTWTSLVYFIVNLVCVTNVRPSFIILWRFMSLVTILVLNVTSLSSFSHSECTFENPIAIWIRVACIVAFVLDGLIAVCVLYLVLFGLYMCLQSCITPEKPDLLPDGFSGPKYEPDFSIYKLPDGFYATCYKLDLNA